MVSSQLKPDFFVNVFVNVWQLRGCSAERLFKIIILFLTCVVKELENGGGIIQNHQISDTLLNV